MKQTLVLLAFFATAAHAQITNPAPYCTAGYDDAGLNVPHYISNVTLGTLNNTSGTTQASGQHYIYYNNLPAPQLKKGISYPLSLSYDNGVTVHFVAAFIDFNHNNSFTDPGEMVMSRKFPSGTNPLTVNVPVPTTAVTGTTRMRVMVFEDDMFTLGTNPASAVPCTTDGSGSFDWGETEDYNVAIAASTAVMETSTTDAMALSPNPASSIVVLKSEYTGASVTLSDIQGRIVVSYTSAPRTIDVHNYLPGIYFAKITQGEKVYLQKLVIRQ